MVHYLHMTVDYLIKVTSHTKVTTLLQPCCNLAATRAHSKDVTMHLAARLPQGCSKVAETANNLAAKLWRGCYALYIKKKKRASYMPWHRFEPTCSYILPYYRYHITFLSLATLCFFQSAPKCRYSQSKFYLVMLLSKVTLLLKM